MSLTKEEIALMRETLKTWPYKTMGRWYADLRPNDESRIDIRIAAHNSEHA